MRIWNQRTNTGRVVYDRPVHVMIARDAYRVTYRVWERMSDNWDLDTDPRFADEWSWVRILDLAQNVLKYHIKYKLKLARENPEVVTNQITKETTYQPTPLHWTAARLIYWIDQVKALLGPVIGVADNATLGLVWNVGMFFLDLALDGLKQKMGAYAYQPNPEKLQMW